jgi:TonB family protein
MWIEFRARLTGAMRWRIAARLLRAVAVLATCVLPAAAAGQQPAGVGPEGQRDTRQLPAASAGPTPAESAGAPSAPKFEEEPPPAGRGQLLTEAQLRYCLAESVRIDAVRSVLDKREPGGVEAFNQRVADFNGRCGGYRYVPDAMFYAQRDVDEHRARLAAEAQQAYRAGVEARKARRAEAAVRPTTKPQPEAVAPEAAVPPTAKAQPEAVTPEAAVRPTTKPQPEAVAPEAAVRPTATAQPEAVTPEAAVRPITKPQPEAAAPQAQPPLSPATQLSPEAAETPLPAADAGARTPGPAAPAAQAAPPAIAPQAKPPAAETGATATPKGEAARPDPMEELRARRALPEPSSTATPAAPAQPAAPKPEPKVTKAAAQPAPSTTSDPALARYIREVQKAGTRVLDDAQYPSGASGKGWKGTVQIDVHFAQGGFIRSILLGESCGHPALDARALEIARGVLFPHRPQALYAREFTVRIPISFKPRKSR